MNFSRREFINRVGLAGGYSAAFATMQMFGLMPMKGQRPEPITASPGVGRGTRVIVLGGGIGGLVSAYELKKLGFEVVLLEARERPGGRNWTGRKGSVIEFANGNKQVIDWEEGNYQNLGPARLPSTHFTMLNYCRELGISLEVEINTSRSALLQNDKANGGAAVPQRKAANDTRGRVSELLSKCIAQGALDMELTREDRERMKSFLGLYGPLDDSGKYIGSDRAGFKVTAGAGKQVGVLDPPEDMHLLLDEGFWAGLLYEEAWDWQATMMQPVGGMDRIPYAFAEALGPVIRYNAAVTEIRRTDAGVKITYASDGKAFQIEAAQCIVALPFSMLKKIPNDFSAPFKQVIDGSTMGHFFKIPWESPRFWETDFNIYGGLSFLSQGVNPIWYPSAQLMRRSGVVVSGYMDEFQIKGFSDLSMQQKFAASRESVEKVHPGFGKYLQKPIFCGWGHIKWNEGSWVASYGGGTSGYDIVTEPDGPFYFAGDSISHIVGWQEGAALSARRAVSFIGERVKLSSLPTKAVRPILPS
jgi:monoamine oxidase